MSNIGEPVRKIEIIPTVIPMPEEPIRQPDYTPPSPGVPVPVEPERVPA